MTLSGLDQFLRKEVQLAYSYHYTSELIKIVNDEVLQRQLEEVKYEVFEVLQLLETITKAEDDKIERYLSIEENNIRTKLNEAISSYETIRHDNEGKILELTGQAEIDKFMKWFAGTSIALIGIVQGIRQISEFLPVLCFSAGLLPFVFGSSGATLERSTKTKTRQFILKGERALREAWMEINLICTDYNLFRKADEKTLDHAQAKLCELLKEEHEK
ncbi:hypothetical protein AC249_AIPGENE19419 [Exaiptasia diaphana]|nr:hypothetical protein AC249_AIPGENE19419 [Exaiptasia diaphana]